MVISQVSLIAAILDREPAPLATLQPLAPPALARVVKQCLAKEPDDRWQSARDLRAELAWIGETADQGTASAVVPIVDIRRARGRERLAWMAALVSVTLVAAVMTWRAFRPAPSSPELPVVSFDVQTPPTDDPLSFALSADGRQLAFVANNDAGNPQLWIRSLDTTTARRLAGTEGASAPFWSPDSQAIGFFADRKLKRVDLAGGAPQELGDAPSPRGGTWNRDDGSSLRRRPRAGWRRYGRPVGRSRRSSSRSAASEASAHGGRSSCRMGTASFST